MSSGGGGGGAGLMSCVREGSVEPPYRPPHIDTARHGEGRTGRFFRGLRRMFKRRGSGSRVDASPDPKSSSTSELLDADRATRRKEGAYGSGLSVSHDSVFTGERSGDESDDRPSPGRSARLASSHRAELVAAVRRRGRGEGSDDDEDLGLPRSPPASPPTDKADKRHHAGISHSSCSDGSLLSVGSSEMDDDSSSTHHDNSNRSELSDLYSSSEPAAGVAPLSHSAARHKMSVRPRRTHPAPRRRKNNTMAASALPITPELNEEMIRSTTPEVAYKTSEVVTESFSSSTTTTHHTTKVTEQQQQQQQLTRELQRVVMGEAKIKSCSLPPGLALSQLGHNPKLTVQENTPRSSIKRSKSSSQGKTLDDEPKTHASTSESHIYKESRTRQTKYAEETCLVEKKSKTEKKNENEIIKAKKEESFFSRLLLRKSGKKTKKDQIDGEQETKKGKSEKVTQQYKVVDTERSGYVPEILGPKPVPVERTHKSAGQRVFANHMHKRIDNKGAYVQEGVYKDAYSAAKVSGAEYSITDLKIADETDRMLNREMKNRFSRRDEFSEKIVERTRRTSSKETIDESLKRESFKMHGHDRSKKPVPIQKTDVLSSKAFIDCEQVNIQRERNMAVKEEDPPLKTPRTRNASNEFSFHSGSVPKNIPYFNPNIVVSSSVSPPKSELQNTERIKQMNRSSEHVTEFGREKQIVESKTESTHKIKHVASSEDTYSSSGLRSLGDEFIESRSSIGKSHSFRYASETTSISSQESQMPSLPAIVGISEPFLESWEVNYRRNVAHNSESFSNRHDFSKRVSARNYLLQTNAETNYDSLPSTDSSYLDSLKDTPTEEAKSLFGNTIHISVDSRKRDSDISQIEAKIDDIISSPKPIMASILKSNSLDSVKSSPEKNIDDRRKTISVASSLVHDVKLSDTVLKKEQKTETENFVSVTLLNREQTPVLQSVPSQIETKITRSDEKLQKSGVVTKPADPEFLKIKLNKVDAKPATNVVLTANVTPKKLDTPQYENDQDIDVEIIENKTAAYSQTVTVNKLSEIKDNLFENISPISARKSALPSSPSTPKAFFKRKSISVDLQDKPEKPRTHSVSTEGSTEKIFDTISLDQRSHSNYGSKSSIQSSDSNEIRTPDRHEEAVIYRKKPVTLVKERSGKKNDDEPELMKVFARRSLKLKDSDAETIAQEIAEMKKEESLESNKTKLLKNEFNASIKSRDSDKENDDTTTKTTETNRIVDIAARVSQFGTHYQKSVSTNSVAPNPKRESAPTFRNEVNKYKKEVSDSTPEKRLRNRTFPDPSNDRDKNELAYKADTLSKRPWQKTDEKKPRHLSETEVKKEAVIDRDGEMDGDEKEKDGEGEPQFKGILQMRAEWERRAKQGMTK